MIRPPMLTLDDDELIVDCFAGGGGASQGIYEALGRGPDVAINHNELAVALHKANHPRTKHYIEDVWRVDPIEACAGRRVGLAWFSPDCTHHSKARGGKPRSKKIRGLAWAVVRWAAAARPRVIALENVEEFQSWGPLLENGQPCRVRAGKTFRAFVSKLRRLGYAVEWRELCAANYGAPTTRTRLFMVARCDGEPIRWPVGTHQKHGANPWRSAAEIIDWSLPCPSIFLTKKEARTLGFPRIKRPLADATCRRIARGVVRFVLNTANPFIVGVGGRMGQSPERSIDQPINTVTSKGDSAVVVPVLVRTAHGEQDAKGKKRGKGEHAITAPLGSVTASGDFALMAPTLVQIGYGEREGQAPRSLDLSMPLGTVVGGGNKHAVVAAFLSKYFGDKGQRPGSGMAEPVATITANDHNALVTSHLLKLRGTSKQGDLFDKPMPTVCAGGQHFAEVRAILTQYYGNEQAGQSLNDPMRTVTAKDRAALVIVDINGWPYALADIGLRMITVRERYRAQGFGDEYVITVQVLRTHDKKQRPLKKPRMKWLTEEEQGMLVGNSVCPPMASAIVLAQFHGDVVECDPRAAA